MQNMANSGRKHKRGLCLHCSKAVQEGGRDESFKPRAFGADFSDVLRNKWTTGRGERNGRSSIAIQLGSVFLGMQRFGRVPDLGGEISASIALAPPKQESFLRIPVSSRLRHAQIS